VNRVKKAEYGDNNPTFHQPGVAYFKMAHFVPRWVLEDAQIKMYGGERTVRKIITTLHLELRGISQFNAQLFFIERARLMAPGNLGHFYKLYANGKGYKAAQPSLVLAIGHAGIRLHKFDPETETTSSFVQFEFDWNGIRNFEIVNKKLILRPENQPSCRKMTFHCGHYERARYLLDLITQAHIFDYNQTQMFPPEQPGEKKPINNYHRELSVDEIRTNRAAATDHNQYECVVPEQNEYFVDVTDVQIKKHAPANRTLSVKAPVRPAHRNHIHVEIPRHTSMSAADSKNRPSRVQKKYANQYDVVYDAEEEMHMQRVHAGSNNDSGISVMNNQFASSLIIQRQRDLWLVMTQNEIFV